MVCDSLSMGPILGLLSFPVDYFITVNHSGLWHRHIAWAKPKGQDLRSYILSQYSTSMVLLSLLLATQVNVFFNSSPELCDLRAQLLVPPTIHASYTSLKFWIAFLLLVNICVTVMGILATFTTWGMISSISDRNSHCLLRSSMGQYVISLPPRLVVASLYLFLTWFLLFVVELVAVGPLLVGLMALVGFLFFSIVVPLSAFGRLIMHTGAMAQRPVLTEELEMELLPNGLFASLVIRAYHHQRRNTSVTNQYRRAQQFHERHEREELEHDAQQDNEHGGVGNGNSGYSTRSVVVVEDDDDDDQTLSHNNMKTLPPHGAPHHRSTSSDVTRFASDNDEEREEPTQFVGLTSGSNGNMGDSSFNDNKRIQKQSPASKNGTTPTNDFQPQSEPVEPDSLKERRNTASSTPTNYPPRMESSDPVLSLPPASILNMSLSGKEFRDLIENTIDTSSVGALPSPPTPPISSFSRRHSDHRRSSMPPGEVPAPHPMVQTGSNFASSPSRRHHRRASSSRFLLMNEWAEESSVRDLYGAAPPADMPREILLGEEELEHGYSNGSLQRNADSVRALRMSSARWTSGSIFGRSGGGRRESWVLSPYSAENENDGSNDVKYQIPSVVDGIANTFQNSGIDQLSQPLLPDLEAHRRGHPDDIEQEEETGDGLHGESFLPGERRSSMRNSKRMSRR